MKLLGVSFNEMDGNVHGGHRQRLVHKILSGGFDSVLPHEILESMLFLCYSRRDTNEIAHRLLDKFGSIYNVCTATIGELVEVPQVGIRTAESLNLFAEFVKAYESSFLAIGQAFECVDDIGRYCVALQMGNVDEMVYVLALDAKNRLIKRSLIAEGNPGNVSIDARKVLEVLTHTATVKVILCHNHPGGTLFPSQKDFDATARVKSALEAIDIQLRDHIIVAKDKYISCMGAW